MNRQEQIEFVNELMVEVHREVCEKIEAGIIPEHWDGVELRMYLTAQFERRMLQVDKDRKLVFNRTVMRVEEL